MKILIAFLLLALAPTYADDITIDCRFCQNLPVVDECYFIDGGPFDERQIPLTNGSTCSSSTFAYPITLDFVCDSSCITSNSCGIQASYSGQSGTLCSNYQAAEVLLYLLNFLYSEEQGFPATYNWCGLASCGGLPGWGIALIVVFSVAAVAAAIVVGVYCYKKKKRTVDNQENLIIVEAQPVSKVQQ